MEEGKTFETIVGFCVLIIAAFFFNYVYTKSSWQSIDGYILKATFDKADGLTEGIDVKISGVKIGKIISLKVNPESFCAEVQFRVDQKLKLPKDTSAGVSSDGLFGGKYLSLTPGGSDDVLKPGDVISNTTGAVNLESMIGKFMFSQEKTAGEKK